MLTEFFKSIFYIFLPKILIISKTMNLSLPIAATIMGFVIMDYYKKYVKILKYNISIANKYFKSA